MYYYSCHYTNGCCDEYIISNRSKEENLNDCILTLCLSLHDFYQSPLQEPTRPGQKYPLDLRGSADWQLEPVVTLADSCITCFLTNGEVNSCARLFNSTGP